MNLDILSSISITIPLCCGAIVYRRVLSVTKVLIFFIAITAVLEGVSLYFYMNKWNNLFIFHIHTFVEFLSYSVIFGMLIKTKQFWRLSAAIAGLFVLFSGLAIGLHEDVTEFNSIQRHIESVILSLYIVLYFAKMLKYESEVWTSVPYNWFSIGLALYLFGNLFLFIMGNEILTPENDFIWVVHDILNIGLNIVFTVVILKSLIEPFGTKENEVD